MSLEADFESPSPHVPFCRLPAMHHTHASLGWPLHTVPRVPHNPESVSSPLPFPWVAHTIEKGSRLRSSVAINPHQLFLLGPLAAQYPPLTLPNLAIVGQECWQKEKSFFYFSLYTCKHVQPSVRAQRRQGLISIVAREGRGLSWRIGLFSCLTKFFFSVLFSFFPLSLANAVWLLDADSPPTVRIS